MQWDPLLLCPERREGGGGAGGSDIRELHKEQTPPCTVQTQRELLAQPQPPNPQAGLREPLAGVLGPESSSTTQGAQAAPARKADLLALLVGSPRGSLCPLITTHMLSPAPDSFQPGQDYHAWQTSHRQGRSGPA